MQLESHFSPPFRRLYREQVEQTVDANPSMPRYLRTSAVSLAVQKRKSERRWVWFDDIARTDAGERIASALRNLHRRPDVARHTTLKPNPHYNKTRYISKLRNLLETKRRNFIQLFLRDSLYICLTRVLRQFQISILTFLPRINQLFS